MCKQNALQFVVSDFTTNSIHGHNTGNPNGKYKGVNNAKFRFKWDFSFARKARRTPFITPYVTICCCLRAESPSTRYRRHTIRRTPFTVKRLRQAAFYHIAHDSLQMHEGKATVHIISKISCCRNLSFLLQEI